MKTLEKPVVCEIKDDKMKGPEGEVIERDKVHVGGKQR